MKVKEIMTKEVTTIKMHMNAKEALAIMLKTRISGLPVVDFTGKLVGMFTESAILASALPSYVDKVGGFVYEENPKAITKRLQELEGVKVNQLMQKEAITVNQEAKLSEVARIMLTHKISRLPVLNKQGELVGIVTRKDIIKAFAKDMGI
jgi:CBS domain-containing protein